MLPMKCLGKDKKKKQVNNVSISKGKVPTRPTTGFKKLAEYLEARGCDQ